MKRALLVLALCGCTFAAKHPAVTVGIASGTIGFTACWLNVEKVGTCGAIGGIAGLSLGVITWVVTLIGNTNAPPPEEPPYPFEEENDDRIDTVTEPPPGLPADAGVPLPADGGGAPPADAAL